MSKNQYESLLDQATAYLEDGEPDKAYVKITEIFSIGLDNLKETNESLYWVIQRTNLSLHNNLKRFSDTKKHFQSLEDEINESENIDLEEGGRIIIEIARANWELGNQVLGKKYLIETISWDNKNPDAQWLFREMNKESDYSNAKTLRVMIEGKWDEPFEEGEEIEGFLVNYDVVAENEDEAMEFIRFFEPPEIHDSLKINEVEIIKSKKQPKGIYGVSEYFFFRED
jgi:hypothetical protein